MPFGEEKGRRNANLKYQWTDSEGVTEWPSKSFIISFTLFIASRSLHYIELLIIHFIFVFQYLSVSSFIVVTLHLTALACWLCLGDPSMLMCLSGDPSMLMCLSGGSINVNVFVILVHQALFNTYNCHNDIAGSFCLLEICLLKATNLFVCKWKKINFKRYVSTFFLVDLIWRMCRTQIIALTWDYLKYSFFVEPKIQELPYLQF